ncbi:uncharacterized protein METZ01_LOCUS268739 [marine metagenome]|uniref:Uncharacterized protein n=1 Tax=marine metagenome TaxID=408172 RepID=A0A382JW42_9ZZZZ
MLIYRREMTAETDRADHRPGRAPPPAAMPPLLPE